MKDIQLCQEIVELGQSMGADEIEVFYYKENKVEVVAEKNDLQVPKGDNYEGIGIRVIKDSKMGFATTNILDRKSIELTIKGALDIAGMSSPSPYNQLPDPRPIKPVDGILDPEEAGMTMEYAVEQMGEMMETLKEYPEITLDSASIKGTSVSRAIANSRNVSAREDRTLYESVVMCFAKDGDDITSFDSETASESQLFRFEPWKKFKKLAERQINSLGATSIPSFKGQAILTPSALISIILYPLLHVIKGDSVVNGMSPLKDKLGKEIASPMLTIIDDPALPGGYNSRSFDREGVPCNRLPIISNGKLEAFIYDHYNALKAKTTSTGHASGDNCNININSTNVVISPGNISNDEMIKGIKKGVIINRFSGNSDPISGDFSGVVKGGFYIENGQIIKPVKEVMVAGNIYSMLHDLVGVSNEVEASFGAYLPRLLFDGVSFTGK